MNIQTIPIYAILSAWRDALKESAEIEVFCQSHYEKSCLIFVGHSPDVRPRVEDCPAIVIFPGPKQEGPQISEYSYTLGSVVMIANEGKAALDGTVVEFPGVKELDELSQIVLNVLSNVSENNPPTSINYEPDTLNWVPIYVAQMDVTYEITPAIGGNLTF